jgi:hypothetical protein
MSKYAMKIPPHGKDGNLFVMGCIERKDHNALINEGWSAHERLPFFATLVMTLIFGTFIKYS